MPTPECIPLPLAMRLHRTGWTWAEKFRRNEILSNYRPKLAIALAADYMAVAGDKNSSYHEPDTSCAAGRRVRSTWSDAQGNLRAQDSQLQKAHLSRAFDESEIRDFADNYSRTCAKMLTLEHRADFALSLGVDPPEGRKITPAGACARMDDAKWWRRQLRKTWTRRAENVMRGMGIVRKGREPYASDDAVHHRHGQKVRGQRFLEKHAAVNEAGEQLNLLDVVKGSVSNPAIRRAEFMTRVRGFEEIAEDAGHVAQFWTLTAPSIYHSQLAKGGRNPKYTGTNVREAQDWLCKQWSRVRAKLKRLSILMYGFRIAEPHHDGTPHWHLLMFCRERDADTIARVIRDYWLKEHAEELGPKDARTGARPRETARVKLITIDRSVGSAAGYVAKYVSKNIDGEGEIGAAEDWETGKAVNDGIRRVDAWAALHGVRQFQQIGGPPVGLWRELRRITEVVSEETGQFEKARGAADRGDWRGFIYAIAFEGIRAGRRVDFKLHRQVTGERTQYEEERTPPVLGVALCSVVAITRPHTWRIERCEKSQAPGSTDSRRPLSAGNGKCSNPWLSLHPGGGLCGLHIGRELDEKRQPNYGRKRGRKRKSRARQHQATQPQRVQAAPSQGRASGSFSSVRVRPWTRGNNCTPPRDPNAGRHIPAPVDRGREWKEWEARAVNWHRQHGRYPTLAETLQLTNKGGP